MKATMLSRFAFSISILGWLVAVAGVLHAGDREQSQQTNGERPQKADRPTPAAAAKKALFFDDFEYVARREDAGAGKVFLKEGGWTNVKTQQSSRKGARGYLYPGFPIWVEPGTAPSLNRSLS